MPDDTIDQSLNPMAPDNQAPPPNLVEQASVNPDPSQPAMPEVAPQPAPQMAQGDVPMPANREETAAQNPQQQQPQQPQQQPQQNGDDLHASLFKRVLTAAGGGTRMVRKTNPTTGEVTMEQAPMTMKNIGAGIVAGALSSMMAGFAAPSKIDEFGHQDLAPSAAAGIKAGQENTPQARQDVQDQRADAAKLQAYQTTKQNYDLMSMGRAAQKQGKEAQTALVTEFAPIWTDIQSAKNEDGTPMVDVAGRDETDEELRKRVKESGGDVTRDSAIPTGTRPKIGPDGKETGETETLWTSFHNGGKITLRGAKGNDPGNMTGFENLRIGDKIPIRQFMQQHIDSGVKTLAAGAVNDQIKQQEEAFPSAGKKSGMDFAKFMALPENAKFNNPKTLSAIQHLSTGVNPGKFVEGLMGISPALGASFQQQFGVNQSKWKQKEIEDQKESEIQAATDKAQALQDRIDASPKGQAAAAKLAVDTRNASLETQLKQQQLTQQAAENAGSGAYDAPANFQIAPNAGDMSSADLQKDLTSKGVKIPANFASLYKIAHHGAPLGTLPTTKRKGVNQVSADEGLNYISQYINPQYQASDFAAAAKFNTELASSNRNTAGGTLLAAGTASNHLDLLERAAIALKNNDTQALNKIKNFMRIQVGSSPVTVFNAIANVVDGEVAKVAVGGQPIEAELKRLHENLNSDQSPEQISSVIDAYIGLMSGRLTEIDARSQQLLGRHVKVSPTTQRVFKAHGVDIGSEKGESTEQPNQGGGKTEQSGATFSVSAWQKANPQGDVNAAKAEAAKRNYNVVN